MVVQATVELGVITMLFMALEKKPSANNKENRSAVHALYENFLNTRTTYSTLSKVLITVADMLKEGNTLKVTWSFLVTVFLNSNRTRGLFSL